MCVTGILCIFALIKQCIRRTSYFPISGWGLFRHNSDCTRRLGYSFPHIFTKAGWRHIHYEKKRRISRYPCQINTFYSLRLNLQTIKSCLPSKRFPLLWFCHWREHISCDFSPWLHPTIPPQATYILCSFYHIL